MIPTDESSSWSQSMDKFSLVPLAPHYGIMRSEGLVSLKLPVQLDELIHTVLADAETSDHNFFFNKF